MCFGEVKKYVLIKTPCIVHHEPISVPLFVKKNKAKRQRQFSTSKTRNKNYPCVYSVKNVNYKFALAY